MKDLEDKESSGLEILCCDLNNNICNLLKASPNVKNFVLSPWMTSVRDFFLDKAPSIGIFVALRWILYHLKGRYYRPNSHLSLIHRLWYLIHILLSS